MKHFNIKKLFVTVMVLLCSVSANAYDFEVDGIYYKILSLSDLTVKVTEGDNEYSGEVIIPSTVSYKSKALTVTSIGEKAFYYCDGLTSITIPNSVTSIGDGAFSNCRSLKDLRIEDGETTLSLEYSFYNESLFYDCPLESLYLGRNIQYKTGSDYEYSPFCENKTLKSVTIGNSVTSIKSYAFNKCTGLTSVTIGNSVTSIGNYAFNACDSLASIRLLGETPPTVGSFNFTNKQYLNTIVYVPKGTLATYQAADAWKEFWDIREEGTTETPDEEVKKCATPVITYSNSGLDITSETDGAEIHSYITCSDVDSFNGGRIDLSATYDITTYATKSGYLNSDTATATLCWIAVSGSSEENSIIEVEAMPVLITCNNGTINISGGKDGAEVVVYTTSGVAVGNATITNGNASISTELAMGEIVVVNIAGKGIKIVMQ